MRDDLKRWFDMPLVEGPDKVCSARDAIANHVQPGMSLHIGCTHGRPYGLLYELIRQFWDRDPAFEVVSLGLTGPLVALVHRGLAKRCISTFVGDAYPTPGPNPVYQKAYRNDPAFFQHWSILTLPLRLKAAAMNVSGLPTLSLQGSTMEKENAGDFRVIPDPFQEGASMGMVRALTPDIAFLHGWVSDRNGNALFTPPYGEGFYGAMASRKGLILSVEKIVPTDFIRQHAHLVKIPGFLVRSVSQVPMGSHPTGLSSQGIPEMEAYADDYAFLEDVRLASREPGDLDAWVRNWILEPQCQEEYLERLGRERIGYLKGKARSDSWFHEILTHKEQVMRTDGANPVERMVLGAARKMADIVERNRYRNILAGVGAANLASWLAYRILREKDYDIEVMAEIGFYGFAPRPADPFIFNYRNMPTCKILTDIETIMGHLVSGSNHRNLGAIGAGQVDRRGNVNSTAIPGKMLLVGSGGANDVASGSNETLVVVNQERTRFVEEVPYITSPGRNVRTVVSDHGVFEKGPGEEELRLTGVLSVSGKEALEERVREIRENCSWNLQVREPLEVLPPPDTDQLRLLRYHDPMGQFLGKGRG